MTKPTNLDALAKAATATTQPVVDFHVTGANDPRQEPPAKTPLPEPLAKSLGINQR